MEKIKKVLNLVTHLLEQEPEFLVVGENRGDKVLIIWEDGHFHETKTEVDVENPDYYAILGSFNALRYGDEEDWAKFQIQ